MPRRFTKSTLFSAVQNLRWQEVRAAIHARPDLLTIRDHKGRNALHLCCAVDIRRRRLNSAASVKTAEILLEAGLDINREAFSDGRWKATPLWFAIALGKNHALAKYLLKRGSDPNYCLWAAAYNDDARGIRLLLQHGAENLTAKVLIAAIQWNRFSAAKELLQLGADANTRDSRGMTPLHYALKRREPKLYVRLLLRHGARTDIKDARGVTAADIMRRKHDRVLRALAQPRVGR